MHSAGVDAFGNALGNSIVGQMKFQEAKNNLSSYGQMHYDGAVQSGATPAEALAAAQGAEAMQESAIERMFASGDADLLQVTSTDDAAPDVAGGGYLPFEDDSFAIPGSWELDSGTGQMASAQLPVRVLGDNGSLSNGALSLDEFGSFVAGGSTARISGARPGPALEMSVNPRAANALDALSNVDWSGDLSGVGLAYRNSADAASGLHEKFLWSQVDDLKNSFARGMLRTPTLDQLGVLRSIGGDGVARYNAGDALNAYRDGLRLVALDKQGVIQLDYETYKIRTIGSAKLSPERFVSEVEARYSAAFNTGLAEANKLFNAGKLPYPADMPKWLQTGLYGHGYAENVTKAFFSSIGVPEGPGQLVSMNRWSYDPSGSGLYLRPDLEMNFGRNMGELSRYVLDAKSSMFSNIMKSGSVSLQLGNYYRYGATTVKVVTPYGTSHVPQRNYGFRK